MGLVTTAALFESLEDVYRVRRGDLAPDRVRKIEVPDALVDTGSTALALPARMIALLGLLPLRSRQAITSAGPRTVQTYGAVRVTIQGRDCVCDVTEVPDDGPPLIGQVPLELLDFVVDPGRRALTGNPAHGGEHVIELL